MAENSVSKKLVNQLFMLIKTAQIHDPGNKAFAKPLELFRNALNEVIEEEGPITIESIETDLYLNELKIRSDISTIQCFQYLQGHFENRNVGGIVFRNTPEVEDLVAFMKVFSKPATGPQEMGAENINQQLDETETDTIEALERKERRTTAKVSQGAQTKTQTKKKALKNYVKAIDLVKESAVNIQGGKGAETRKAKRIVYNLVDICLSEGFSFFGLSNIKNYDEYTFNHSVNVCIISIGFGKNLGLTKKQIGELGLAGLYHDYGKLSIPKNILNKPGKFDADEWEVMKSHPMEAIKQMIQTSAIQEGDIKKLIAAFEHHRNFDCSGYPQTGVQKPMNFYSKVVAIADAYDAMTTNRVYQRALPPTIALKILLDNAGTKFDPVLVKAYVNTIGIYPVGSALLLSNGSVGVVTAVPKNPAKMAFPTLKIAIDGDGQRVNDGPEIDLLNPSSAHHGLVVANAVQPDDYGINVAHYLFEDVAKEMGDGKAKPSPATN